MKSRKTLSESQAEMSTSSEVHPSQRELLTGVGLGTLKIAALFGGATLPTPGTGQRPDNREPHMDQRFLYTSEGQAEPGQSASEQSSFRNRYAQHHQQLPQLPDSESRVFRWGPREDNTSKLNRAYRVCRTDSSQTPVINLKFFSHRTFNMEGIHVLRDLLRAGDRMANVDLTTGKSSHKPGPEQAPHNVKNVHIYTVSTPLKSVVGLLNYVLQY